MPWQPPRRTAQGPAGRDFRDLGAPRPACLGSATGRQMRCCRGRRRPPARRLGEPCTARFWPHSPESGIATLPHPVSAGMPDTVIRLAMVALVTDRWGYADPGRASGSRGLSSWWAGRSAPCSRCHMHRYAAHSWVRSRAFTRLRRTSHFIFTVGAPSGAMLFCTVRTCTSTSLPFDRLRTGRTTSGPGPSDLALASLRASLRGARCGHLVPSFHSPSASELLSLAWPRESNQREGHPDAAVSGHPALRLRAAAPGLADSPSVDWQPTGSHPCEPPFGPCLRRCATA